MKTVIKLFAAGIALAAIICCLLFTSICSVRFNSEALGKISVFDNLTFTEFEITDPFAIDELVLQLNGFSPSFGVRAIPTGSHYTLHLYDPQGAIIDSISIVDPSSIVYGSHTYWTDCQATIDYLSAIQKQTQQ